MYYWNKYGEHKLHRLSDLSPEILDPYRHLYGHLHL